MMYACLILPFPGSVNTLWRAYNNRNIKSARGREYDKDAARALERQRPLPFFSKPVQIVASMGRPDKRRRDIDNHWKAAGDALVAAGVLADDSLIHRLTLQWVDDVTGVRVEIEEIATETASPLFGNAVERAARSVA
jgi:crossover junction endodeoxyribonuclease RusA